MKALILVGGYGTRLRPLTFSKPKPLVEFANDPMILHQIKALVEIGVTEVVLAVNYQPEVMLSAMQQVEEKFKVKITFSIEPEPLGTAGPLRLARDILTADGNKTFFVLNSDVICEFPFKKLLDFHLAHNGEGTLMTTDVDDPSKYGVILSVKGSTLIEKFVEKPKDYVGKAINAGIYVFNTSMLDRIPEKPTSIEKEIFPPMAAENQLHSIPLEGFWADVGQPKDFLIGTALYLESLKKKEPASLVTGKHITGNVMIDPTAKIGNNCKIGPNVTIGAGVVVGDGVRLKSCVLMKECHIKDVILFS
jgi:mannose-1-phosphate guanylyltransferase